MGSEAKNYYTKNGASYRGIGSHPIFCMGKTLKNLFFGLSLLPNNMETLATKLRLTEKELVGHLSVNS